MFIPPSVSLYLYKMAERYERAADTARARGDVRLASFYRCKVQPAEDAAAAFEMAVLNGRVDALLARVVAAASAPDTDEEAVSALMRALYPELKTVLGEPQSEEEDWELLGRAQAAAESLRNHLIVYQVIARTP